MTDDATYRIIDLDADQIADIAAKFNISPDEVRQEWEKTKAMGAEKVMADLDYHVAEVEQQIDEVVADTAQWFGPDRHRAMADYYRQTFDAIDTEGADVADLVMKLSITIYKLAEAQQQVAALMEGNRRSGVTDRE